MSWDTITKALTKGKTEEHLKNKELYCQLLLDNFSKLDPSLQVFIITSLVEDIEQKKCPLAPVARCKQGFDRKPQLVQELPDPESTIEQSDEDIIATPAEASEMRKWLFKAFIIFVMFMAVFYIGIFHITDHLTGADHDIFDDLSTVFEEFMKVFKLILGL